MRPVTRKIAFEYGVAILVAVAIAVFIRFFVVEAYRIPTAAMHPALEPGDTIFVAKWPLGFDRQVQRGDVLVFTGPTEPDRDYIKRAIGVAGDTIEVRKGRVYLNSKPVVSAETRSDAACGHEELPGLVWRKYEVCWDPPLLEDFGPEKVPEGGVFVIGDLRTQSPVDNKRRRTWGIIPIELIRGKAKWIWLSIEPRGSGVSAAHFPNFRFDRMFRRIQ
jgi:signal peptidase I